MKARSKKVFIGEREFTISELTCGGRDVILDIIGEINIVELSQNIAPILSSLGVNLEGDGDVNLISLATTVITNPVFIKTIVSIIINVFRVGPQIIVTSIRNISEEDIKYILENITMSQESEILLDIIELNKLPDTLKNYKSLLSMVRTKNNS